MRNFKLSVMALALAAGFAGMADAATVTNVSGGRLFDNQTTQDSYLTGGLQIGGSNLANFVIFSVSDLAAALGGQSASSATLTFSSTGSHMGSEVSLYSFEGNAAQLQTEALLAAANNGSAYRDSVISANGLSWLTDLGTGVNYGTATITGGYNAPVSIVLSTFAVTALNNAIASSAQYFVIGGVSNGMYEFIGGDATAGKASLDVAPVPLPAGLWLLGSGLAGLGAAMRRRKVQVAA